MANKIETIGGEDGGFQGDETTAGFHAAMDGNEGNFSAFYGGSDSDELSKLHERAAFPTIAQGCGELALVGAGGENGDK